MPRQQQQVTTLANAKKESNPRQIKQTGSCSYHIYIYFGQNIFELDALTHFDYML